jgi:hypothetical protein
MKPKAAGGAYLLEPTPGLEPGTARLQGEQLVPAGLSMPRNTGLNAVIAGNHGCPEQEFMDKLMDSQSAWTIAPSSGVAVDVVCVEFGLLGVDAGYRYDLGVWMERGI